MKKIVIMTILLFMPLFIKAADIDKLLLDSEVDISGNLIVREVIDLKNIDKEFSIYYKNEIDDIYNGTTILIKKVGILEDINTLNEFYNDNFAINYVTPIDNYLERDDGKYVYLTFDHRDVYYIEYTILNLCVKHNDAAEIYYRYLYNFNHDIKDGIITLRLPIKSNIFDVYIHSDAKVKANKDIEHSIITLNISNFKKDKYLDIRLLYDKDIFRININNKNSNINILDVIKKQESNNNSYIIYIILLLIIILIILDIYSYIKIDVVNYNITDKRIDKDIKLLVLSDMHDRNNINNKILDIVGREKPDYILISGDAINGKYKNEDKAFKKINIFIDLCKKLKKYNVYYTYGNHETYVNNKISRKYKRLVLNTGVKILNNDSLYLSKNVRLNGIFYEKKYYSRKKAKITNEFIESKLGKINSKNYNVLINHNPLIPEPFSKYGFDLMISGHVHGGVVRLPWPLLSPEYKFFPKYSNGLYNIDKMKMIVSRGIGYSDILPIRINNPAHIMIINLSKK